MSGKPADLPVSIRYGREELSFSVPEDRLRFVLEPRSLPPVADVGRAVAEAVQNPIGSPPISSLAGPDSSVVILIEDNTRSTPLPIVLPPLVQELNRAGVPESAITLLVATGTHRKMSDDELLEKYGHDICNRFRIVQHQYRDPDLVEVGYLGEQKIPVRINPVAVNCDLLIGLGNIIPHCDLGYSGGAKILQPGICGYPPTAYTHFMAGVQDDIPLGNAETPPRIEAEKIAKIAGLKFILNVVLNASGDVIHVVAGDPVKAHRAGVVESRKVFELEIPERADIVVCSSYPADLDYWQAMKGLAAAYFAVKPGGVIILVTPCPEGVAEAHPRFMDWVKLSYQEGQAMAHNVSYDNESDDLIAAGGAIMTARIREFASIMLVSEGISEAEAVQLGFAKVGSVEDALTLARRRFPNGTIGVIRSGGHVLPKEARG